MFFLSLSLSLSLSLRSRLLGSVSASSHMCPAGVSAQKHSDFSLSLFLSLSLAVMQNVPFSPEERTGLRKVLTTRVGNRVWSLEQKMWYLEQRVAFLERPLMFVLLAFFAICVFRCFMD